MEIGIIKAQLAASILGKVKINILKSLFNAKDPRIGKSKIVVAVLLINSVRKETKNVTISIIKKIFRPPKKSKVFEISLDNPVFTIADASDNPPPKSIKTFQGIFRCQAESRI